MNDRLIQVVIEQRRGDYFVSAFQDGWKIEEASGSTLGDALRDLGRKIEEGDARRVM